MDLIKGFIKVIVKKVKKDIFLRLIFSIQKNGTNFMIMFMHAILQSSKNNDLFQNHQTYFLWILEIFRNFLDMVSVTLRKSEGTRVK